MKRSIFFIPELLSSKAKGGGGKKVFDLFRLIKLEIYCCFLYIFQKKKNFWNPNPVAMFDIVPSKMLQKYPKCYLDPKLHRATVTETSVQK